MNKILFRGQLKNNNEWCYWNVYGELVTINGKRTNYTITKGAKVSYYHHIYQLKQFIIPETVGQYIGITDKNVTKIFEEDIVSFKRVNALGYTTSRVGDVRYYDKLPIFYIMATTGDAWDWVECENIEVIGNIHDNPELLKGDKDNA